MAASFMISVTPERVTGQQMTGMEGLSRAAPATLNLQAPIVGTPNGPVPSAFFAEIREIW